MVWPQAHRKIQFLVVLSCICCIYLLAQAQPPGGRAIGWSFSQASEDYEDIICNGWVYEFLSGTFDSCIFDTIFIEEIYSLPQPDSSTLAYEVMGSVASEICFDYLFGVVEVEDSFRHYYFSNPATFVSSEVLELEVTLNGEPISDDEALAIFNQLLASIGSGLVGTSGTLLLDCEGIPEQLCFNDSLCYAINSNTSIVGAGDSTPFEIDTIPLPADTSTLAYIELWNNTDQQQALCDADSRRLSPCDTCQATLAASLSAEPYNCFEDFLPLELSLTFDYEYCQIADIEIGVIHPVDEIIIAVSLEQADPFDYCRNCGMDTTLSIPVADLPLGTYDIMVINATADSLFTEVEDVLAGNCVMSCFPPPIYQLSAANQTTTTAEVSINQTGYVAYEWRYRTLGASAWTPAPVSNTPTSVLTGLEACKNYEAQIRVNCGDGVISEWFGLLLFSTECAPVYEVNGLISTASPYQLDGIEIILTSDAGYSNAQLTVDGFFAFPNLPSDDNYELTIGFTPLPNLGGISTFDILIINRHILGIQTIAPGIPQFAADPDRSGSIDVLDIVALRRVILGLADQFPFPVSWAFFAEDGSLIAPSLELGSLEDGPLQLNIQAVEIGNVSVFN